MRYRIMRNGMGQYYVQYRRCFLWWDYQLPINADTAATVIFPTEDEAVKCVHRLALERERPILVREYKNPALAKLHLDDFAEAKKRVAAAEATLARIFSMYSPVERQNPKCTIARVIQGYYDKYHHPIEDKNDE